jgi:hypothetical protein
MDAAALLPLALLVSAVGAVLLATARANEVFRIAVRDGDVTLVRGRAPPGFLEDVRKLTKGARSGVVGVVGVVRAVKRSGRPLLVLEGFDVPTAQRLRNTFATHAMTLTRGRAGSRL